jgi:hypothetical protein
MDTTTFNTVRDALRPHAATLRQPLDKGVLREKVNEFVGLAFFGTLLQVSQDSALKAEYGHGGRGEEIFQSQLNLELAREAGRTGRLGIGEAIYERIVQAYEGSERR